MERFLANIVLITLAIVASARSNYVDSLLIIDDSEFNRPEDRIYTDVDQAPQFRGGEEALLRWIADHIKFPQDPENFDVKYTIQFVVERSGTISEIRLRDCSPKNHDLNREVIRVVKTLPRFEPGFVDGQPVRAQYTLKLVLRR